MTEPKVKEIMANPFLDWAKDDKRKQAGIGIYCRVSTTEQRQLRSLSNQVTTLIKELKALNCLKYLKDVYIDIYTGTSEKKRPEFNRMLEDVKAGRIKIVVTKNLQRFGRNTATVLDAIETIRKADGVVYFDMEKLDTLTRDNDVIISVLQGVHQDESYFKSQNIRFGIKASLQNPDSPMYNRVCYGYWQYKGKIVPAPITAGYVKEIFCYYKEGKSLSAIARIMTERGIPSPTRKNVWWTRTIEKILKNEKYTGNVRVLATPDNPAAGNRKDSYKVISHHEGIISQELFDEVQLLMEARSSIEHGEDGKKVRKKTHYSSKNPYRVIRDNE